MVRKNCGTTQRNSYRWHSTESSQISNFIVRCKYAQSLTFVGPNPGVTLLVQTLHQGKKESFSSIPGITTHYSRIHRLYWSNPVIVVRARISRWLLATYLLHMAKMFDTLCFSLERGRVRTFVTTTRANKNMGIRYELRFMFRYYLLSTSSRTNPDVVLYR